MVFPMKNISSPAPLRDDRQVTLAVDPAATALTVQQVLGQVALIQQIMSATMKDGEHYGRIPGCGDKPTLLKPGAEKLCLTFRLAPTYEVDERTVDRNHREYRVQCALTSVLTGAFLGQGVGICSTMEAKYRFRAGATEATDKSVPRTYWDLRQEDPAKAQELLGGKGFSPKKVDGAWMIAKASEKVENDNPADSYNTVLKMAKKRALVDAVLTATAASDIFTQDLEDISANLAASMPAAPAVAETAAPRQPLAPAPVQPQPFADVVVVGETRVEPMPTIVLEDDDDEEQSSSSGGHMDTRIHFGKNRGLTLSELTPQQVHWYESDWMPKKEVNGPTSVEDLALINALKAYRQSGGSKEESRTATVVADKRPRRHAVDRREASLS